MSSYGVSKPQGRAVTDKINQFLTSCVRLLTLQLNERMIHACWDDPHDVGLAEKWMRVLSSYGRNIEKCIAMTNQNQSDNSESHENERFEKLRSDIERRLSEYADRIGEAELARRVHARGFDPADLRLELLGQTKPESTDNG